MVHPVVIIGRRLKPREPDQDPALALLDAAVWAVRSLKRYTMFPPPVHVKVAEPELVMVLSRSLALRV